MNYKKIIAANENINLKMPSFLWQGNLPNRASKIKRLLARHDIHLPRASVKLHLWCIVVEAQSRRWMKHKHCIKHPKFSNVFLVVKGVFLQIQ
jgi:hypothetical protein